MRTKAKSESGPDSAAREIQERLSLDEEQIRRAIAEFDSALAQRTDPDGDEDHDFGEEGGEGAGAAVDRDRDSVLRTQLVERLNRVAQARERLDKGTYGLCSTCHEPISAARLEAMPAASECIACAGAPLLSRRSR